MRGVEAIIALLWHRDVGVELSPDRPGRSNCGGGDPGHWDRHSWEPRAAACHPGSVWPVWPGSIMRPQTETRSRPGPLMWIWLLRGQTQSDTVRLLGISLSSSDDDRVWWWGSLTTDHWIKGNKRPRGYKDQSGWWCRSFEWKLAPAQSGTRDQESALDHLRGRAQTWMRDHERKSGLGVWSVGPRNQNRRWWNCWFLDYTFVAPVCWPEEALIVIMSSNQPYHPPPLLVVVSCVAGSDTSSPIHTKQIIDKTLQPLLSHSLHIRPIAKLFSRPRLTQLYNRKTIS